jgi:hypothetical protein
VIITLLTIIVGMVTPIEVLAYNEAMAEIVVGGNPGLIVQNQSYSTSIRQNLFHSATAAASDTESFAFGGSPQTGIQLAQSTSALAAGTETGFFNSSASSDIVPPLHIGNGYLGTWIGDPLWTGTPIYSGLMFPQMTRMDPGVLASQPKGLVPAGSTTAAKSDAGSNKTKKDVALFQPVINNALNDTLANQSARNATTAAAAAANATNRSTPSKNATSKPAATPSPAIKPGQVFYHQQNKPFSMSLTTPSGPYKYTTEKVRNVSAFDRFLINTVGRSTTDKAFNGTTSSPTYITPGKALAEQIPYDFIQGARGMTMPGTHLNYRAWPL